MLKISPLLRGACLLFASFAFFLVGCSPQKADELSGVWRAQDVLPGKNLVIEFVPGGTGQVFSGSIIGFPTDASFKWQMQGDQIKLETVGSDPVIQTMTVLSQELNTLSVEVNRTQLKLVRVDDDIADDLADSLTIE